MNGHVDHSAAVYGQRLPLRIIDERAKNEPSREWLSIPRTSEPVDGWERITYRQAAKAINRIGHKITAVAGQATPGKFPTIAYIGPNDTRYLAFMYGAVKARYKALFISPRNSVEGQLRLFQATDCWAVASSQEFEAAVQSWVQHRPMKSFVLPSERELLGDADDVSHIPYDKDFSEAQWEPLVVLHSSGSSGFPKPIVLNNGNMATADGMRNVPRKFGSLPWVPEMAERSTRILTPMPLFHIAGLYVAVFFSTFYDSLSLGIGTRPITADLMHQCLQHSGADAVFMPPSVVDDMALVPEYIEILKKLKFVAWGGGSLTPQGGDTLVKNNITLCNLTSSTEAGPYPFRFQPNSENWRYFIFDNDYGGNEFRRLPGDEDIYKHFFKRQAKNPGLQGIFWTFPDIDEFDTQDLYRPHPTLEDHWLFYGRADSIIVFSTGEKLNPVTIEAVVLSHPQIKGTLVVGSNRLEPALILEPVSPPKDEKEAKELIQSVWPLVQEANRDTVAHGHIQHDMIMLTTPDKPFPRAGKGTIQRPVAVQLYEEEIARLYENAPREQEDAPVLDISSESTLRESIETLLKSKLDVPVLGHDTDFFTMGMDSLQVIVVCRLLAAGLKAAGVDVGSSLSPRAIYSNPSLNRLAVYVFKLAQSAETHHGALNGDQEAQEMKAMIEKYTKDLPEQSSIKTAPRSVGQTVLLTGSTGALGSYLLNLMASSNKIDKVICLNRAKDGGRQQQEQACAERGLTTDFSKCEFLHANPSLPDLGLEENYSRVVATVDRIIHNAWPVNFNIPLSSFDPSIRGVRHLVDLSIKAPKQVPIIFVSSISTVDGWTDGSVPELPIQDLDLAAIGYGQSKHISSLILDEAARLSGVPTASIRVGQIAGPRGDAGAWNRQEWLPSIIASSLHLGALPTDLGRLSIVDWVPIEDVANLVVEISQQKIEDTSGYFHCVNPATTTWSKLAPAVKEYYGSRITQLVTFKEWVELLRKSAAVTKDVQRSPGIKLLDTYEAQASADGLKQVLLDMERTKKHVVNIQSLEAITPALIQNWCRQWDF